MSRSIIRVYYSIRCMLGFSLSFFFATYTIFLISAGLDLFQVNLVNTCFMFACFFLEVPTGAVADVYGRKVSFVLSCLVLSLGFLIYYFSHSFTLFVIAEVVAALGHTLYTGAFKSWMIDEIKRTGEIFDLTEAYRNGKICSVIGQIVGAFIGGYIGKFDIALPWLLTSIFVFATGLVGVLLIKENTPAHNEKSFSEIIRKIKMGYRICRGNSVLMYAIALGFFWNFSCGAFNMYWQPRYQKFGLDTGGLGWLYACIMIMVISGTYSSKMIIKISKDDVNPLLLMLTIFCIGGFFAAFSSLWVSLPMFFIHEISRGMYEPLLDDFLNKEIGEEIRATIQSYQAMVSTLGAGLGLAISGLLAKSFSIELSWIFSSSIIFLFFSFSLVKAKK